MEIGGRFHCSLEYVKIDARKQSVIITEFNCYSFSKRGYLYVYLPFSHCFGAPN